ncbi:amino-acid N-acetyltransferase [Kingella kingae]|uniref:amino-acid N-acetyltransferase n=1 Tax=Kingella kingae TaxID=504 RepID=UPI00254C5CE8|nr:amino-acid N-acetyltransferase [Kingella kingae]MDK4639088.1 amino-acid N-acetyltransferase [Kingella kingae]MDK4650945.1 amino-acid N-acetyltransferase [Kingella kingae]
MENTFVHAFREAAPYIHYLRGKTVVVGLASALLQPSILPTLAADLNLLAALGVRLVLVHGVDTQLRQLCQQNQYIIREQSQRLICDETLIRWVKQINGELNYDVQAALSLGFAHSPQRTPRLRIAQGNFLSAKPLGVLGGVDMLYTGGVRKVDGAGITHALNDGSVVLVSPLAASASGQIYHLPMDEVAQHIAQAVSAEKLIFLIPESGIMNAQSSLHSELTAEQAQQLLREQQILPHQTHLLQTAIDAVQQGISRVQILSGVQQGDLLRELFTRHGAGTSIAQNPFIHIRRAQSRDIADIIALIQPLAEQGVLLPRSREYLEAHLAQFYVLEHDRQISGCVELKTFANQADAAELACLAVSQHARDGGYGEHLLAHLVQEAKAQGKTRLFALSTRATDWFQERGFVPASVADLPNERREQYLAQARQSKIFVLDLAGG